MRRNSKALGCLGRRRRRLWGAGVLVLAGLALQPWSGLRAQALDRDLAACAKINEPARRLACYDAVMRAHGRGLPGTSPQAATPAPTPAPADGFGLPGPRTAEPAPGAAPQATSPGGDFGLPPPPPRETARDYVLKAMDRSPTGEAIFHMEDGAVWRQIDDKRLPLLKPGTKIRVKRGLMGSFLLVAEGWSVRARRIR